MVKARLLLLSRQGRASLPPAVWARLSAVADVQVAQRPQAPDPAEAARLLADVDVVGATNVCLPAITAAVLDAAPRLRGIVLYATGYDHLDLSLLARRRVGLSVVPDYATNAVAEHTMALALALATRLHLGNDRCRGMAPAEVSLRGIELCGKTMGVVGAGRIGTRVAALARAFGMRVVTADCDATARARARRTGLEPLPLEELLTAADVVSVCASHRFGAPPLIGAREVALLRPGAFLVNAARSALVDTDAVAAALRAGRLRGYAVDDELPDAGRFVELSAQGRLLQTGHSAWWRDEVLQRGAAMWGERLVAAASGNPLDVVCWPQPQPQPQRSVDVALTAR